MYTTFGKQVHHQKLIHMRLIRQVLMTPSHQIKPQTKNNISPLTECLWQPDLVG